MTGPACAIVVGPAGSGKSTIARDLATRWGAAYLDKDRLAGEMVGMLLEARGYGADDREFNDFYRTAVMPAEYRALLGVAGDNLRLGSRVVIDAPFATHLEDPGYLERAAAEHGWPEITPLVLQVTVSPEILRNRLRTRGLERDAWKLAHWDEYLARFSDARCRWRGARIVEVTSERGIPDELRDFLKRA